METALEPAWDGVMDVAHEFQENTRAVGLTSGLPVARTKMSNVIKRILKSRPAQQLLELASGILHFLCDLGYRTVETLSSATLTGTHLKWRLEARARAALERGLAPVRRVEEAKCSLCRHELGLNWRVLDSIAHSDTHSLAA